MAKQKRTIKYLDENIRISINNDVMEIAAYHARPNKEHEAGFFSIPRNVFCYIDYLGYIAFGYKDNRGKLQNTKYAVDFIKKYFPPNYQDFAELIYAMWRHGTVHAYEPKSFFIENPVGKPKKITVRWLSNNSDSPGNRKAHMKFFPMQRKRACLYLVMNICQLVDDLLISLDNLLDDLTKNHNMKNECEKRLNEFGIPLSNITVLGKKRGNDIKDEVLLAWKRREKNKINERGETVS